MCGESNVVVLDFDHKDWHISCNVWQVNADVMQLGRHLTLRMWVFVGSNPSVSTMKYWTQSDCDYLRENIRKKSYQDIATHLGKTFSAIKHKVAELGLSKQQTGSRLIDGIKTCSKCQIEKKGDDFANNATRADGKEVWCKQCRSFGIRENKYGINEVEYKKKWNNQNGKCAICFKDVDNLYVDHCHATSVVRDLLCGSCNLVIGNCKENPAVLASAILYLKKHGKPLGTFSNDKALSPEFLVNRGYCCGNGCRNCPY